MSLPADPTPAPEPGFHIAPDYWEEHKTKIFLGIAVIIGILLVYGITQYASHKKATAATNALASAKSVEELQKVAQDFSGSPAGANALLLAGEKLRNEKKYDESIAVLKKCTETYPDYDLIAGVWMSLASTYEAAGKTAEAVEAYQLVATKYPKSYCAPSALLSQASLQAAAGKAEDARRIYESILTQYPDSFLKFEAQRRLQTLGK